MNRFTITLTLTDAYYDQKPISWSMGVDEAMRISVRTVDEIKLGVGEFKSTVETMKIREFRKDILIEAAKNLASQMADMMADAEGWHDTSRIEPARKTLGGNWK